MSGKGSASLVSLAVWIISGALIELLTIFAFQNSGATFLIAQNMEDYVLLIKEHPLTFIGRSLMSNVIALDVFIGFILRGAPNGISSNIFILIMVIKAIVPPFLVALIYTKMTDYDPDKVTHAGSAVGSAVTYGLLIMAGLLIAILYNFSYVDGWEKTSDSIFEMMNLIFGQSVYFVNESLAYYGIVRPPVNYYPSPDPFINELGDYLGSIFSVFGMSFVLSTFTRFIAMLFVMRKSGDQFSEF